MIDIKELALEIANNPTELKLIEIVYTDGETIVGQLERVPEDPMVVYIRKKVIEGNEQAIFRLEYERLKKITITYYEPGKQRTWEI